MARVAYALMKQRETIDALVLYLFPEKMQSSEGSFFSAQIEVISDIFLSPTKVGIRSAENFTMFVR